MTRPSDVPRPSPDPTTREDRAMHPDPEIAAGIEADAREAEAADIAAGYPPRPWCCDCGETHDRGHFGQIGVHRCLACGYVGSGGTLLEPVTS